MFPDLLLAHAKPIAAGTALVLLLVGERLAPASPAGAGSLRHDARNLALGALNALLGIALAAWLLPPRSAGGYGLLGASALPPAVQGVLAFLLLDLWMFVWHRTSHAVPWLWRVHRMHHSDPTMDASTALRFHPFEVLLSQALRLPVALALGIRVEHVAVYEAVLLPVILLHHSNLRLPARLERLLRPWVVTPGLHRIHHSPAPAETDSNFGSVLTVWDRLARTLRGTPSSSLPAFGLTGFEGPRWESLPGLLATPFRASPAPPAPPAPR